jgi:hypothetical protein
MMAPKATPSRRDGERVAVPPNPLDMLAGQTGQNRRAVGVNHSDAGRHHIEHVSLRGCGRHAIAGWLRLVRPDDRYRAFRVFGLAREQGIDQHALLPRRFG